MKSLHNYVVQWTSVSHIGVYVHAMQAYKFHVITIVKNEPLK